MSTERELDQTWVEVGGAYRLCPKQIPGTVGEGYHDGTDDGCHFTGKVYAFSALREPCLGGPCCAAKGGDGCCGCDCGGMGVRIKQDMGLMLGGVCQMIGCSFLSIECGFYLDSSEAEYFVTLRGPLFVDYKGGGKTVTEAALEATRQALVAQGWTLGG